MAASVEEKFNAAVKVIRGLPKNGTFQPSHEMMLKFYAYFKQATEGPCNSPKPGMWNLVNRKKWEAWSELGQMKKETAMMHYVEELKHIVETMPQTELVTDFVDTLGSFYELVEENAKESPEKAASRPNGSAAMNGGGDEEESQTAVISENLPLKRGLEIGDGDSDSIPPHTAGNGLNGISANGHRDTVEEEESGEEEEEDRELDGEEEEDEEEEVDSGSENEEFCDSSDRIVEVKGKETAAGLSFTSRTTEVCDYDETSSMRVNFSTSSLSSLLGTNSVPEAERCVLDGANQTNVQHFQPLTSRGEGGQKVGSSFQGSSWQGAASGGAGVPSGTGRGSGQGAGRGASRRALFPSGSGNGGPQRGGGDRPLSGSLNEQILMMLLRLQQDMALINNRLTTLELSVKLLREEQIKETQKESKWWPFKGVPKVWVIFLITWPFIAPAIINLICHRRRSGPR